MLYMQTSHSLTAEDEFQASYLPVKKHRRSNHLGISRPREEKQQRTAMQISSAAIVTGASTANTIIQGAGGKQTLELQSETREER